MILFLLIICSSINIAFSYINETPIIGILAVELNPKEELSPYSSQLVASYVKAVESSAARVVPIVPNKNESYYKTLLNSINGVILPGGDVPMKPGYPTYDAVSQIYKISKEINDAGKPFPILGVCLGFEFLLTVANNDKNFLANCSVHRENLAINFTRPYKKTVFFSRLSQQQYEILSTSNVTVNQHTYCAFEDDFNNSSLKDWTITSTSTSAAGHKFVASVEHKRYPFFGVQFHPEKIAFEWAPSHHYPHSEEALIANRYFYDTLVHFSRNSTNKFHFTKEGSKRLIYNFPAKSGGGYFQQYYLF